MRDPGSGPDLLERRRRLAELLLDTVLEGRDGCGGATTAELKAGVEDAVCAFLGHPRHGTRGERIPPGTCCRGRERTLRPLVQPLDQLAAGESARIVYIAPKHPDQLVRLSNLGVVPGAAVRLQQKRPATVIAIGETTLAVDSEITEDIYVKRLDEP